MQWRIARGAGVTGLNNMVAKVTAFLDALADNRYTDWTVISATYAPEDSDIFLPAAAPTPVAGTATIPTDFLSQSIFSLGFVGRSSAGQKARVFVYGTNFDPESGVVIADNFRVTAAEATQIDDAVTVLNNGSPNVVGSDDEVVGWYSYANGKYNDFWLRQVRG